jgi:type IV pilus modification protein PilV
MYAHKNKSNINGFSLIEVMIAVLVLAVGILAVSKLQTSLLKSGSDANHRSVAASLANRKIDDLKRFAYLNVANSWSAALTSPTSISFNHIASNEGGLLGPGDVGIGNQVYTLNWTVSNYQFSGEGNDASISTPSNADMKAVHVTVSWDGPGDTTNNIVSFDTFIHGYHPLLTAVDTSAGTLAGGDINLQTRAADSETFDFGNGKSFGSELIAPDVSKKGNSTVTKTVFSIFDTSSRVLESSDEFRTVACLCKNGTRPSA